MKTACPRCGANVYFDPSTQKCHCEYCGSIIDLSEFELGEYENTPFQQDYDECRCSSCGAALIVDKDTTITRCIYCGSNQILKNRFVGDFRPEEIIPFKLDHKQFIKIYRDFVNKRVLAPEPFRRNTLINDIKGVYVPFYIYTFDTHTTARGQAYKRSNDHSYYKYFETEFDLTLSAPQDASEQLSDDIMTSLEPFRLNEVQKFNPAYLNGFSAENGNETFENLEKKANIRKIAEIKRRATKRLQGFRFEGGLIQTRYKILNRKYVLLPVWFFTTPYDNKKYSYAVNGQTGKVVGQIPLSSFKFGALMALLVMVAFILTCIIFDATDGDDDAGEILGIIWGAVIAVYVGIKARYRNVKKVTDNPIPIIRDLQKSYQEYSKGKYDRIFGKHYENHKIEVKDEKITNEFKEILPNENYIEEEVSPQQGNTSSLNEA